MEMTFLCQNFQRICLGLLGMNSSLTGDILEILSKFTKFPVAIVNGGGDKAFLYTT